MLSAIASPPPRFRLSWRLAAIVAVVVLNLVWGGAVLAAVVHGGEPVDWWTFEQAAGRVGSPDLYVWPEAGDGFNYTYRYSPLFAWLMVPVTAMGIAAWRLLHLPWRLALLTILTWPFWEDVWHGNVMTFVFVSGFLALRGGRLGAASFLVLALLVPRPLMLPLLAWLIWKRPAWRGAGFAIVAVMAALTVATGYAVPFVEALSRSANESHLLLNPLPSRFIGFWWLLVGVAVAAWLTWKCRIGWASLAASPYLWPYHGLMLLLETTRWKAVSDGESVTGLLIKRVRLLPRPRAVARNPSSTD